MAAHLLGLSRAEIAVRLEKVYRELMEIKAECLRLAGGHDPLVGSPGRVYTEGAQKITGAVAGVSAAQAVMLTIHT